MNCKHDNGGGCASGLPLAHPVLFVDASAPFVQVGVWQGGRWLAHRCVEAPALEAIFRCVRSVLTEAGTAFSDLAGFIHNEGPGSILGIRLSAMALRVWALGNGAGLGGEILPVWAVRSLPLVAAKIALQAADARQTGDSGAAIAGGQATRFAVVSEFRQGFWNWFEPTAEDAFGDSVEVIETAELEHRLATGEVRCHHLRHRKSWAPPPGQMPEADSDLADCPQVFLHAGLLRQVDLPEAFLSRPPEFKTSDGERHRGGTVPETKV